MYAKGLRAPAPVDDPEDADMRPLRDETGGIEGMPLQLMIMVIVAGLTLAVVLGWILSVQTPAVIKGVSTSPATVDLGNIPIDQQASRGVSVTVAAYDGRNARIPGIAVTLGGAVESTYASVDEDNDGAVTFPNVGVFLPPGVSAGEVTVTIQKAGYPTKTWSIPVVRGL